MGMEAGELSQGGPQGSIWLVSGRVCLLQQLSNESFLGIGGFPGTQTYVGQLQEAGMGCLGKGD